MIISVNMSVKLKDRDYITMLDRINIISDLIDNSLQQHPVAKIDTDIKNHITKIVDDLHTTHRELTNKIKSLNNF